VTAQPKEKLKITSIIIYRRCTPVRRQLNGKSPLILVLIWFALRKSSQKTKRNCFHQIQRQRREDFDPGTAKGVKGGDGAAAVTRNGHGGAPVVDGDGRVVAAGSLSPTPALPCAVVKFGPNLDLHCVG
jgi:hypothetical protein